MQNYLFLLKDILENGIQKTDRTGTGTLSLPFKQLQWDLSKGFPLVTTKKVHLKSIIYELLWFIRGSVLVEELNQVGVKIWDEWKLEDGTIGPAYGQQIRAWPKYTETDIGIAGYSSSRPLPEDHLKVVVKKEYIDQLQLLIDNIKKTPDSRRLLINTWNVADLDKMALTPCHMVPLQVVISDNKLNLQWYQRSWDLFLGASFNIASYALLTHMLAQVTDYEPGLLSVVTGDTHIYLNHVEQVKLQLTRESLPLPTLKLNPNIKDIFDFKFEDITVENYRSHPSIKAPVAV